MGGARRAAAHAPGQRTILAVGTLALDTVETPAGRVRDALGGSATYFSAAASMLAPVRVVGVVGEDYPVERLAFLERRGVDLAGVTRSHGASFRWSVRYGPDLAHRETLSANRGVTLGTPPRVPAGWRRAWAVFLGSTDPSVQAAVLGGVSAVDLVALDTMRHWIADRRRDVEALLPATRLFLANEEEVMLLGGGGGGASFPAGLGGASAAIRARGPEWVVVKRGAAGATAFGPGVQIDVPAAVVGGVVDPTGAGDAFAGGLLGHLAREGTQGAEAMERALRYGAVAGAMAVASFLVDRLRDADAGELARYAEALETVRSPAPSLTDPGAA